LDDDDEQDDAQETDDDAASSTSSRIGRKRDSPEKRKKNRNRLTMNVKPNRLTMKQKKIDNQKESKRPKVKERADTRLSPATIFILILG
jgi:hypothetical protein